RARLHARHRELHDRFGPRAEGEPWSARATVRLSDSRRRELHAPHHRPLARRWPGAVDEARPRDEMAAAGADVLMRRRAAIAVLLGMHFAAAAGGGGGGSDLW